MLKWVSALLFSIFIATASAGWLRAADPAQPAASLPSPQEINAVLSELADITGFRVHRQLPFAMVTRDEVNRFLKSQMRRSVKPGEIRAEEATLKKFGFVAPDFDLKKTTIDLLTEQAAAYYDFHRKKLFISDWASRTMREAALIHELAHALADQNFPIQKFLAGAGDDSEESLARETVVEGQASWLMIEVAARRQGTSLGDPQTAGLYLKDAPNDDAGFPVFSKAPLYLRRTLLFPYEDGERFQQAVFTKDGKAAFSEVFQKPPATTSEVLHPDRYFDHTKAGVNPTLPKSIPHSKALVTGTMGELDHRILLRQYLDGETADALGPKLKGASYRIDEAKPDHRMMLVYASDWESDAAASDYFDAYQKVLRGKWKSLEVAGHDPRRFAGKSEDGYFSVALNGTQVLSEEGFASPL